MVNIQNGKHPKLIAVAFQILGCFGDAKLAFTTNRHADETARFASFFN